MRSHNLQGEREAEIIRQALDRHLGSIETRKPNIAAWEAEKAFITRLHSTMQTLVGIIHWQR